MSSRTAGPPTGASALTPAGATATTDRDDGGARELPDLPELPEPPEPPGRERTDVCRSACDGSSLTWRPPWVAWGYAAGLPGWSWVEQWIPPPPPAMVSISTGTMSRVGKWSWRIPFARSSARVSPKRGMNTAPLAT